MKPILIASLLTALGTWAQADRTTEYTYFYAGKSVGKTTITWDDKGGFKVSGGFDLGVQKMMGTIEGKLKPFTAVENVDAGKNKARITYKDKKCLVLPEGGKAELTAATYSKTPDLVMSNLTPAFMSNLPDLIKAGKKKVIMLVVESGQTIDSDIAEASAVIYQGESLRHYTVSLAGLKTDILISPKSGDVVGWQVPAQTFQVMSKGYEKAFVDPVDAYPELSAATHKTKVMKGVRMKTRDGVELAMDIALPAEAGKYPTILQRTPYGREASFLDAEWWARRGYAYVSQDTRGRSDSDGEFDPFFERKDGADSVDWIAQQDWSDGNVGMIGGSYAGVDQWQAAVEAPKALKCIIPQVSPPDPMKNIPYTYGVPFLMPSTWWANIVKTKKADMTQVAAKPVLAKFLTMPLSKVDDSVLGQDIPFFNKWWERTKESDWVGANYQADLDKVNIPALMISGWWDGDTIGTRTNWERMRNLGKKNQWLIYGPWEHGFNVKTKFADQEYGPSAILELQSLYVRWFDTWLKGKQVGIEKVPTVRYFVTGANKWQDNSGWPTTTSKEINYYFQPKHGLAEVAPASGTMILTSDPAAVKAPNVNAGAEVTTKMSIPKNSTGCIMQTAPFSEGTTLGGPVKTEITFSSSAQDCDFIVMPVDIDEKGVARMISLPSAQRASYRKSLDAPEALVPGQKTSLTVEMVDFAHYFAKGHRFGMILTTEMFPSFARNTGIFEPISTGTKMVKSTQTIELAGSRVILRKLANP